MMKFSRRMLMVGTALLLAFGMVACGVDDAAVTAGVKAALVADSGLATTTISVDTQKGVVTLSGTVGSDALKSKAEEIAKGVKGVKSVVNNLTVKAAMAPIVIAPDTVLKTAVIANLAKYGITDLTVEVANGEVTLKGNIMRAKLQDAIKAANEAKPKKVNNQLTIK
jgi:osmotically-inducible protein OsmY